MLSHSFYVIIYCGISAPGNGKQVVDGLNTIYKRFLIQLIPTVQMLGENNYYTQMVMHTGIFSPFH